MLGFIGTTTTPTTFAVVVTRGRSGVTAVEDSDSQFETPGTVVTASTDEVHRGAWSSQVHNCFTVRVDVDWVYGFAGFKICEVHFQDVVDWRVVEHCSRYKPNYNQTNYYHETGGKFEKKVQ